MARSISGWVAVWLGYYMDGYVFFSRRIRLEAVSANMWLGCCVARLLGGLVCYVAGFICG